MTILATLTLALHRACDLILGVDPYRQLNGPTASQRSFYGGKW
jgi:hypothetical protein